MKKIFLLLHLVAISFASAAEIASAEKFKQAVNYGFCMGMYAELGEKYAEKRDKYTLKFLEYVSEDPVLMGRRQEINSAVKKSARDFGSFVKIAPNDKQMFMLLGTTMSVLCDGIGEN